MHVPDRRPVLVTAMSSVGLVLLIVGWALPAADSGWNWLTPPPGSPWWSIAYLGSTLRLLGVMAGIALGVRLVWQGERRRFGAGFLVGLGVPFSFYMAASVLFIGSVGHLGFHPSDYVRPVAGLLIVAGALVAVRVTKETETTPRTIRLNFLVAAIALTGAGTILAVGATWRQPVVTAYHWFDLELVAVAVCIAGAVGLRSKGVLDLGRGLAAGAGVDLLLHVPIELDAAVGFPDPIAAAAAAALTVAGLLAILAAVPGRRMPNPDGRVDEGPPE